MHNDISKIIVSKEQLQERIVELGAQITADYKNRGCDEITIICVTNGAILFCADLMREIDHYTRLDSIRVSSYHDETRPVTDPEIVDHIRLDISGRDVLLIDDVLDTGQTLQKIIAILTAMDPASLHTCVLLNKRGRRQVDYEAGYAGFEIPDTFVVGYGLDFAEHYRNLPYIGVLKPELQNPPSWL